jgi:hypothetical protein
LELLYDLPLLLGLQQVGRGFRRARLRRLSGGWLRRLAGNNQGAGSERYGQKEA